MDLLQKLYEEFRYESIYLYNPDKRICKLPCKYCGKDFKQGDYLITKPLDVTRAYHIDCYRKLKNEKNYV